MSRSTAELLGAPPLLRGENQEQYQGLLAAIREQINPETFLDEILARDMADKLWEKFRYQRSSATLVGTLFIQALACLLEMAKRSPMISPKSPLDLAKEYYDGDTKPARLKELTDILDRFGISEELIRAKAMQLCGNDLAMFSRMRAHCEAALRNLQKESERRAKKNQEGIDVEPDKRKANGD